MIGVLVVDDQVLIRAGLVAVLTAAPGMRVVGEAADGEAAQERALALRPDVILMDIRMPGLDGIEATRRILDAAPAPAPRVLMLTTFDLDEYVYHALKVGAQGFLLKDTPPERIIAAVSTVAGGDMLFAPTVTRRLIEAYAPAMPDRPLPTELDGLTAREREVVRLVGAGLSNAEIAKRLIVSEATAKTHLNRAMTKLGLVNRAQVVVVAYETRLVTPGRR
ncbi:response regulator transcription factor [Asanoa sp. WMMD1127]|uniref:response regulator n=1 Tax=Asanoa sp. WMMD1127 TaxID=3016107 RepID=UPI002417DDCF|nr:response regulator transcription factor [Asanoa sp. WMMD1127]MDG4821684.1 response regulator transcription factor [Asanoa sp. WMMD1127]